MKWGPLTTLLATLGAVCAAACALTAWADEPDYRREGVSPLTSPPTSSERLIEPASPILGPRLLERIRADDRPPAAILASLDAQYPLWQSDMLASTIAYTETLAPGLEKACRGIGPQPGSGEGTWRQVEPACIPSQVLTPLHQDYFTLAHQLDTFTQSPLTNQALPAMARMTADTFQAIRDNCGSANGMHELGDAVEAACIIGSPTALLGSKCVAFTNLNLKIMSPEFSYPRLQFAVNGFTQYVYNELLGRADLPQLLEHTLAAEAEWLEQARAGRDAVDMTSFIEAKLAKEGISKRDAILVLAYSTRNMPSIDIQYARNTRAAMTLELYFWKFKKMREELREKYTSKVFPGHAFGKDADLYHYYTAALQACELHRAGFGALSSEFAAAISKVGYKSRKFLAAVEARKLLHGGTGYLRDLAKKQNMAEGIELGISGGEHGVDACPKP